MDPLSYNEIRTRPSLEERLESIISGAALMADSSCTREISIKRIGNKMHSSFLNIYNILTFNFIIIYD
jgi:catenin alpha